MAETQDLVLKAIYEDGEFVSDNVEAFVETTYKKSKVESYKVFGDILNVTVDIGGRRNIKTHTIVRDERTKAKPLKPVTESVEKK